MFSKVLIANRGEIAVRIHWSCKEMGISTVAVHSEADAHSLHVKLADESVCIGPAASAQSYLNMPAIMAAAELTNAEAIHPGYGFLAENAKFAEIVQAMGFTFIGPYPEHIRTMGDKIEALEAAQALGLPTIPGSNGLLKTEEAAVKAAQRIGYPVILKAAAGGGGRGMKVATSDADLRKAMATTQNEAKAAFGDARVYLEKYLQQPRHIEVQVLADTHGNVSILGERDCTLQRRHQKIVEEAPSPVLDDDQRQRLFELCHTAMQKLGYVGAGTLEFLYEDGAFYFIEMNTRLQVEHPVTEMTTGIDLVREQVRIAAGLSLTVNKPFVRLRGHSIECRINAEDGLTGMPRPGPVEDYFIPGGPGVRMDSMLYPGYKVSPHYDATVGKLIVFGIDRAHCIERLQRALDECVIAPLVTNIPLHQKIVRHDAFRNNQYDIKWLEHYMHELQEQVKDSAA